MDVSVSGGTMDSACGLLTFDIIIQALPSYKPLEHSHPGALEEEQGQIFPSPRPVIPKVSSLEPWGSTKKISGST
ncbi:hypothetical protein TNCV_2793371 [Trichonephila clavipes]|nr:hypothetical protein TNCV_2793371 [Trichonephila clavipes]